MPERMMPQRMNTGVNYWEISRDNYEEYTRLISKRSDEKSKGECGGYVMILRDEVAEIAGSRYRKIEKMIDLERSIKKHGIVSIVFAALYLESEAYTYLAHHLSDDYVKDHLDRLSPLSKWVTGIKMIAGKDMNKGGIVYQSCDQLFKYRNILVPNKSMKFVHDADALFEMIDARDRRFEREVKNSQRAVQELAKFIKQLHSVNYVPVLNT